ncbi:hypothetical protein B0H10DRAFT_2166096 [Mycena sp. CBHHK59/15]|nr:hypothetical protein B0H10DRAFT_2166096 [Mycena sp. CBHHK59/15]
MSSHLIPLPPSVDLSPHLNAHKYFLVGTLTVVAWDTLVLSSRDWALLRTRGWPLMKILFHFMRVLMPLEWAVVGVAFFDNEISRQSCDNFYLFEPICTAVLLAAASAVHVIRISAIYEHNRSVLFSMASLWGLQVAVTGVCCAFFKCKRRRFRWQGCMSGPAMPWVGMYWVAPTLLYTGLLATKRSLQSLQAQKLGLWRLWNRDGLTFYAVTWIVNIVNMLFWFIIKPTDSTDTIKTIVSSMAAVLTTAMALRIVLSVRGTLASGGTFFGSSTNMSGATHVNSRSGLASKLSQAPQTYTLDEMRSRPEVWGDAKNSTVADVDDKAVLEINRPVSAGVQVTIDREVGFDGYHGK